MSEPAKFYQPTPFTYRGPPKLGISLAAASSGYAKLRVVGHGYRRSKEKALPSLRKLSRLEVKLRR